MNLKKIIISEECMIFGCNVTIFGCGLLFLSYFLGIIGAIISPKIYFSDIYSSTLITLLVCVILVLIIEKRSIHRKLLKNKNKEE